MLELILSTLRKYADKKLTLNCLLTLDHNNEFPNVALKESYNPTALNLPLLFISGEYDDGRARHSGPEFNAICTSSYTETLRGWWRTWGEHVLTAAIVA